MIWGPIGAIGGWGIGHPMSPFELKVSDRVDGVLATIHSTLSLGLGYVSSTPGLMAWWWWDEREREMWFDVDLWIGGSSNLEVSWCLGPRCGLFPVEEDAEALHPDWPFGVLQHLKGGISMQHQSASVSCLPFVTQGELFESARLMALLDRVRATLPLHAQQDMDLRWRSIWWLFEMEVVLRSNWRCPRNHVICF